MLCVIASIAAFWIFLAVTDQLLKGNKALAKRYRLFLDRYGLFVSLGRVQWYTNRANKFLAKLSSFLPYQWQQAWFTAGAITGVILVPFSVGLLMVTLFSLIKSPTSDAKDPVLVPVMPGVNLPWNQLLYFLIAIAISAILHELGHAIAAVR
jgi:S2P endopeptidase